MLVADRQHQFGRHFPVAGDQAAHHGVVGAIAEVFQLGGRHVFGDGVLHGLLIIRVVQHQQRDAAIAEQAVQIGVFLRRAGDAARHLAGGFGRGARQAPEALGHLWRQRKCARRGNRAGNAQHPAHAQLGDRLQGVAQGGMPGFRHAVGGAQHRAANGGVGGDQRGNFTQIVISLHGFKQSGQHCRARWQDQGSVFGKHIGNIRSGVRHVFLPAFSVRGHADG